MIYLEAGYPYALYVRSPNSKQVDWVAMRRKVDAITHAPTPQGQRALIQEMLQTDLLQYEQELKEMQDFLRAQPDGQAPSKEALQSRDFRVSQGIHDGAQRYTGIKCPVLAIFNQPGPPATKPNADAKAHAQMAREAINLKGVEEQERAFERLGPNAHVVKLTGASHHIFRSNEADVLREMNAFIGDLK